MGNRRRHPSEQEAAKRLLRARLRAAGSLLAGTALIVTGCSSDGNVAGGDPLLGPAAARPAAQAPAPAALAAPPSAQAAATPLPRQAAPAALTSNAALANGVPDVPDNGQDLRIAGSYPRSDTTVAQAGAVLQQPQSPAAPVAGQLTSAPIAAAPPPSAPSPSAPAAPSFEQTVAALNAHHVSWQRLETLDSGGWKFSCSLPNPQNPGVSRTYTATAAEPVAAVRAVLEQIDRGQ